MIFFTESAHWADLVLELQYPTVCLSVYVCLQFFQRFFFFRPVSLGMVSWAPPPRGPGIFVCSPSTFFLFFSYFLSSLIFFHPWKNSFWTHKKNLIPPPPFLLYYFTIIVLTTYPPPKKIRRKKIPFGISATICNS